MVREGGCTEEGVDDTDTSHHSQLQAGWVIDHCQPPYACETTATQSFCSYVIQGAYYLGGGRLLHVTTDWRILCRPMSSIQAVRQLSAGKSGLAQRSSPGSPRGRKVENFDRNGCARREREARRR